MNKKKDTPMCATVIEVVLRVTVLTPVGTTPVVAAADVFTTDDTGTVLETHVTAQHVVAVQDFATHAAAAGWTAPE